MPDAPAGDQAGAWRVSNGSGIVDHRDDVAAQQREEPRAPEDGDVVAAELDVSDVRATNAAPAAPKAAHRRDGGAPFLDRAALVDRADTLAQRRNGTGEDGAYATAAGTDCEQRHAVGRTVHAGSRLKRQLRYGLGARLRRAPAERRTRGRV